MMENLCRVREHLLEMGAQHMSKGDYVSPCGEDEWFAFCKTRGRF